MRFSIVVLLVLLLSSLLSATSIVVDKDTDDGYLSSDPNAFFLSNGGGPAIGYQMRAGVGGSFNTFYRTFYRMSLRNVSGFVRKASLRLFTYKTSRYGNNCDRFNQKVESVRDFGESITSNDWDVTAITTLAQGTGVVHNNSQRWVSFDITNDFKRAVNEGQDYYAVRVGVTNAPQYSACEGFMGSREKGTASYIDVTYNNKPFVDITTLDANEVGKNYKVEWVANDADNDELSYNLFFSTRPGGKHWVIAENMKANVWDWNTSNVPEGTYVLDLEARDGFETTLVSSLPFFLRKPVDPEPEEEPGPELKEEVVGPVLITKPKRTVTWQDMIKPKPSGEVLARPLVFRTDVEQSYKDKVRAIRGLREKQVFVSNKDLKSLEVVDSLLKVDRASEAQSVLQDIVVPTVEVKKEAKKRLRRVEVVEVDNGQTKDVRTNFYVTITNDTSEVQEFVTVVEVIPKEVAEYYDQIAFTTPITRVIDPDPIVEWVIPRLEPGEAITLSYFVKGDKFAESELFEEPSIVFEEPEPGFTKADLVLLPIQEVVPGKDPLPAPTAFSLVGYGPSLVPVFLGVVLVVLAFRRRKELFKQVRSRQKKRPPKEALPRVRQ